MNRKKTKKIIGIMLVFAVFISCTTILIVLMKGKTITSGQNPISTTGKSLTCESAENSYPIATYDNSTSKNLKIVANFYENKINAISLMYELFYNDTQQIISSEAHNHAAMNISFGKDGLGTDAFNANYSKMKDSMKINLYANADSIKPISAKYFMINIENNGNLPNTIQEYQNNYEKQGFACIFNNN